MFRNGHQELLFPICRSIRRLVDEGKPAVVSTAELFETKMKVLENVTGPRVTKTGHFKVGKQSPKLGRYNLSFQIVIDI